MVLNSAAIVDFANFAGFPHLSPFLSSLQNHPFVTLRAVPAIVITTVFAALALHLRAVTRGGAIAGWIVSTTIFICAGPGGFLTLAAVFALTTIATRLGSDRKQELGTRERRNGRQADQVLANLLVAAAATIPVLWHDHAWIIICAVAALAEAAADTVSSECGQAWSDRVYLVTSFERVPVGTDGGISIPGTVAGICAAAITTWVAYSSHLLPRHAAILAAVAAVVGMFADSLLGAAVERRRWLGNNGVNFFSTLIAALLAAIFVR